MSDTHDATYPHDPAHPLAASSLAQVTFPGLSKRETFAIALMSAYVPTTPAHVAARLACEAADELIKTLSMHPADLAKARLEYLRTLRERPRLPPPPSPPPGGQ